jgi:uncharacterized membrane protein YkoI
MEFTSYVLEASIGILSFLLLLRASVGTVQRNSKGDVMKTMRIATLLMAGALVSATGFAQNPKSDIPADLSKEAKVTLESARKTALAAVRGGKIQSEELEREKGKLVYSFDIKVGKKSGVEEVAVDALTGKIVEKKHETAKAEKAEAKADEKKIPNK